MNLVNHRYPISIFLFLFVFSFSACEEDPSIPNSIVYQKDGRTVKAGDPRPIVLDVSGDGQVDFTIFVELTANSQGDRLYAGVNPIGGNQIKSGPFIDENFLSMGFLISEPMESPIDLNLQPGEQWTNEYGALVIRNTFTQGGITYEGNWADAAQMVGIQNNRNGNTYLGWVRIEFDKATEVVTLIDYAYDSIANQPIRAGAMQK